MGNVTMSGAEMRLIGTWWSPYTMRARIALNLKGSSYEFLEETFGSKSELLLKSNPVYKRIPVLLHGHDRVVCESILIVEYVDAVCGGGPLIVPVDPYDLALARFWIGYLDDKWYPFLRDLGKAKTDEEKTAYISHLLEATKPLEDVFLKCSKGKDFFNGDNIGYLDIALGCYLGMLSATGRVFNVDFLDEKKTPLLAGWAQRFCAHDAVKVVMPEFEEYMEFSMLVLAKWKADEAQAAAIGTAGD